MTVMDVVNKLGLKVFGGADGLASEVLGGYTSDLLSDVMGNVLEGQVWITLQTHKNVMAIASLRDISAIILVNDNEPDADMLDKANQEGVPVLGTAEGAFEISGKLYQLTQ